MPHNLELALSHVQMVHSLKSTQHTTSPLSFGNKSLRTYKRNYKKNNDIIVKTEEIIAITAKGELHKLIQIMISMIKVESVMLLAPPLVSTKMTNEDLLSWVEGTNRHQCVATKGALIIITEMHPCP